jgi:Xaa-Pro aminopeptidase
MRRVIAYVLFALCSILSFAQYTNPHEIEEYGGAKEFAARRALLAKNIGGKGTVLLFARINLPEATHYREDNDFFYYTGLREPGAVFMMDAATGKCAIFMPQQSPRQAQVYGPNLMALGKEDREARGFSLVFPLADLDQQLARLSGANEGMHLWVRMGFPDKADGARMETGFDNGHDWAHPYGSQEPENLAPIHRLQERYPMAQLHDLTPLIDEQRNIKTAAEIEVLRRVGKLGAAGLKQAISKAHPGMMQYEVEAEAAYVFAKNGAEGWAYPAIVGSGKNANTWHYFSNRNAINPGEVVVFDFSPSLNMMTMDITRTFAIDGKFTPEQAKWYSADLEAQKAVIELLRPGNTYEQAAEAGRKVFEKYGVLDQWWGGIPGHWVGLATHDVGGRATGPIKVGQVLTVEPIIEIFDKHWHFRVEDTILISDKGPEILSADVPKEIGDVEKLVGSALMKQ